MKKTIDQRAASVLESKLNKIAALCGQIEQIINLTNDQNKSKPIHGVLSVEADKCAAQRYQVIETERLSATAPGTSQEEINRVKTLVLAEAGHADHPGFFLWQGINSSDDSNAKNYIIKGIDFASDLHISYILRQLAHLRHYAELAAKSEQKFHTGQQNARPIRRASGTPKPNYDDPRTRDPVFNPTLTDEQIKGLEYDVEFHKVSENFEFKFPSASSCAAHVGVADQAISKWRNDPVYLYLFERICLKEIATSISASVKDKQSLRLRGHHKKLSF